MRGRSASILVTTSVEMLWFLTGLDLFLVNAAFFGTALRADIYFGVAGLRVWAAAMMSPNKPEFFGTNVIAASPAMRFWISNA